MQRHAVDENVLAQNVTGRTGNIGDDGRLAPRQCVEQTGFAGVGTTRDDHGHAIAQQGALPRLAQHCG